MQLGGNGRDVTGMDINRKTDDVMSVSSVGQAAVSRDRHVAERMYVYY